MRTGIATVAALLYLAVAGDRAWEGRAQAGAPAATPVPAPAPGSAQPSSTQTLPTAPAASTSPSPQRALVEQYCLGCHSDRAKAGGLALSQLNLDAVHQNADIAEKVIRKLRGGLMPPAGARRPDSQSAATFVSWLEGKIDTAAAESRPGRVPLRRLNRREYENAVRDLLALNIDAKAWLPDDNVKGHFDNDAAALQVSPNFVDQYIYAARAV